MSNSHPVFMKIAFLLCVISIFVVAFVESADIGNQAIPLDVTIGGKTVPAGTYAIRLQNGEPPAVEFLKDNEVVASETPIVLPAGGEDEVTITVVKSKKHDYVRIRIRNDSTWYIVYLPATQHAALGTQHS